MTEYHPLCADPAFQAALRRLFQAYLANRDRLPELLPSQLILASLIGLRSALEMKGELIELPPVQRPQTERQEAAIVETTAILGDMDLAEILGDEERRNRGLDRFFAALDRAGPARH